ncbi:hypothetical protein [Pedobacter sp. MW01-1-1]|uniref:hypothetical protein n=1 Tax=Pedobacter sp. MW01-1-1 TaxID=3383027 RepID=UPI003FEF55A1
MSTKDSLSKLLNSEQNKHNILLLLKNDECDACKKFYSYVDSNFVAIQNKLPKDTEVYEISINNFNSENMWIFHVLEGYGFPTILYIDKDLNVKGKTAGCDLYKFDDFLRDINNAKENSSNINPKIEADLRKYSILLKGYVNLKERNAVSADTYNQVTKEMNYVRKTTFISGLLEAYYYKINTIHPERVAFIKKILLQNIAVSKGYFNTEQKLTNQL